MSKSSTDLHWNKRAATIKNDIEVNIMDVFQRNLEYDYICEHLNKNMQLLEVGCGNGISTDKFRKHVKHVDAFDYAENMVDRAKKNIKEKNNTFFVDNVLNPKNIKKTYDAVVCVRVLINLRDLKEQKKAIENLTRFVKRGGLFILVEGYTEGFAEMNKVRKKIGLPSLKPAEINFYSSINHLMPLLKKHFKLEDEFHLGAYDYLTRVVYPCIVGPENAKHNTVFSEKSEKIARAFNADAFKAFSRIQGLVLRKK